MNPFPGLRPFTQEEDYLFFGREEQTLELLQRLGSNRFVAVVGTSGSGKSSLVRCGLLSELLGGRMMGAGSSWEIAVTHPGGNPLALLTDSLLEADLYDREEEHARENLLATLSRSHFGLVEAVKQADLGEGTNFLLVVDQFEEIFRFQDAGQRQQEVANEFVSLLLEAVAQKDVPIYVVLTMRSDFIGECGQFEGLAEMVNRGEFLIPRLTREQYKRVIEGPIKVAGGQIAPRLLQRLLNDLGQQADQLPCLQHSLMRTWDVWAQKKGSGLIDRNGPEGAAHQLDLTPFSALDLDDYQRVGRMTQALSLHADEIYDSLANDRQRELCKGIFQALTVEESNNRGIRRPQRLGRLCQILEVATDELRPIIDAYRQSGVTFLMPSPEVELTEQTIIDISHESLMRVWTRLRQWVEEESQAAGIYHRLSESAALHELGKAGQYRDPELGIALAWQEDKRPNAAWAERYRPGFAQAMAFLEASQQASVADEQAREAARKRELAQAQELAEAQQLRLEQQQRSARKLRTMIGGLAVVAIVAVCACVAALVSNRRASDLAVVAQQKSEIAEASAADADRERKNAERALAQVAAQKAAVVSSLSTAEDAERSARAAIDNFLVKVSESQLLATPGLQPLRAELLDSASRFYEDFLAKNPDNREIQAGLADAFYRVGFVNNELGNYAQALQTLGKSIALWESAIALNPADPALRNGLAATWFEVSRAQLDQSSTKDQTGPYEAARNAARLWNLLATDYSKQIGYKKSLARAFNLMGMAGGNSSQHQERSFLAYQQSLKIRLALLPENPDDVELLHGLGESFNNLGLLVPDAEHRLSMLQRSIEFNVRVVQLRPQNVEYALDLGIGYSVTGSILNSMKRMPEALASYHRGVDHMLAFIQANPAVPAMRDQLNSTLKRIRALNVSAELADDYADVFQKSYDTFAKMRRKTADDHFHFAQIQADYASQLYRAHATAQKRALKPEEETEIAILRSSALESLRLAIGAGFKDAKRLKQDPLLADVRAQVGFDEIVTSLEAASSTGAAVVEATVPAQSANDPIRPELDRATSYQAFGMIETRLGRKEQARKSLEEALALRQSMTEAEPSNDQRRADLNNAQAALGQLIWNEGRLTEALKLYNEQTASLDLALQQAKNDESLKGKLAIHHRTMADSFAAVSLWEEAVPHYLAAMELERSIPDRSEYADINAEYAEILSPALELLLGNDEVYYARCAQLLTQYGPDTPGEKAVRIARLIALRPIPEENLSRVLALAEKAKYHWHAYTNALVTYRAGRFEDAVRMVEDAQRAKTYTGIPQDNFVLAMANFQLGKHDRAREVLNAANLLSPVSMDAGWHSPGALLDVDWIVPRREANELIYGSPFSTDERMRRGRAFAQLGDMEKAVHEFTRALEEKVDYPLGHFEYAHALALAGRNEQADQTLMKAQTLRDTQRNIDVNCWRLEGETLRLLNQHDEAIRAIRHACVLQSLVVARPRSTPADQKLLFDLYENLADGMEVAGRVDESQAARKECTLFVQAMGLNPWVQDANDLLAVDNSADRDAQKLISGINQLLSANQPLVSTQDTVGLHLSAKLHLRKAELLRNIGTLENEIRSEISTAQGIFEKLLVDDPQNASIAAELADVLLVDNHQRAIAEYSKLITDQTTDVTLLSKRAASYIATEQWDLVEADWLRVIKQQPDQAQKAFDAFKMVNRWQEAAEFGLLLIGQKPEDTMLWVQVPPVAVLSEHDTIYPEVCQAILELYRKAPMPENFDRAFKACLLKRRAIDVSELPLNLIPATLDEGKVPDYVRPWIWSTRALLAYRQGDAELAVKSVNQSEQHTSNLFYDYFHAINLAVLAMAEHDLMHREEAQTALNEGQQLLTRLQTNDRYGHDTLIAEILLREAEALMNEKEQPKESVSEEK